MQKYSPKDIEAKWQKIWTDDQRYSAPDQSDKPKYYVSGMFPYPSGAGMHTGHFFEHSIVDAVARFKRATGHNVMYPMGWDAFGLPAENYAIKTGTAPSVSTKQNIENFTHQLQRVGASIDWSREINTSDPEYYKWTQWVFTEFFKRGLAYQKEANQWWCPEDKTVLANEQVEGGKCWRCGSEVEKRAMKQWFFKITDYADALLEEIPSLDWPEKIKTAQTNWIGKSQGAEIDFAVEHSDEALTVFTTRPDTIFGATFMVIAPEHSLIDQLTNDDMKESVQAYVKNALKKSDIERQENKEKTGVFTGSYAVNPATGESIPIWVADYVLGGYGTGAIMAVPAHDERDNEFAKRFNLPITKVITGEDELHIGDGLLTNSAQFDDMKSEQAREEIVAWLEQQGLGRVKTQYKMRDWLISRQRYWGAPIPIIYCPRDGTVAVPKKDLPVVLPEVDDYEPKGESVLASQNDWLKTICPTCGGEATRETDTMDGYACSSWYLLRYTDPKNDEQAWTPEKAKIWSPIDLYCGGDHAVAHLLYVRFWNHVFYEMGLVPSKEPVKKLVYHGYINAEDGTKMSKSKGNVVDPLEVIDAGYGADTLRTFELFLGPINENSDWNSKGIAGVYRFLNRAWNLTQEYLDTEKVMAKNKQVVAAEHRTIKKVTDDINRLSFNTAIAALMEYVNELYKLKLDGFSPDWQQSIEHLVILMAPFAPHLSAELWEQLGHTEKLDFAPWPIWDENMLIVDTIDLPVQINGKMRGMLQVSLDANEEQVVELAKNNEKIAPHLKDKELQKVIYIPQRIINIVI
jgi:leucyl-tRNA synthetase